MQSHQEVHQENDAIEIPAYPEKSNRYSAYWWNRNFQYCYTDEELLLLQKIREEYKLLLSDTTKHEDYFALMDEKQWNDWWQCKKPAMNPVRHGSELHSFTLPSREAKDIKIYPLWSYADNMARQIANWQGERVKKQNHNVVNDPVMLVLEELKYWFFNELSEKDCKIENIAFITARQSYINKLTYMIPDFGPDKLYLRQIQQNLEEASKMIINCVANKELPHLLSDLISQGKSLEQAVATYLYFLLIDEEVSENFSREYIQKEDCKYSPVCKIYKAAQSSVDYKNEKAIAPYRELNRFYESIKIYENDSETHMQIKLKEEALRNIKFASFVNEENKIKYLETIATLESLANIRHVLEKFQDILPRIGTYMFAINYLEQVDALSSNYISLIHKGKNLINELIIIANKGLNQVLSQAGKSDKKNKLFEKNLRALETKVADKTTIKNQLEIYSKKASDSMNKYQQEMRKLVAHLHSGSAARELEAAMQDVYSEMNHLNLVIPAQLTEGKIAVIPRINAPCSMPEITAPYTPIYYEQHSGAEQVKPTWLLSGISLLSMAKTMLVTGYNYITYRPSPVKTTKVHFSEPVFKDALHKKLQYEATYSVPSADQAKVDVLLLSQKATIYKKTEAGRSTVSRFNQPLSLIDKIYVAKYILHYARKYSFFTLPWNKPRVLTGQEISDLKIKQKKLYSLQKTFDMQKTSAAARSGMFSDQYEFVIKNLAQMENNIHQILKQGWAASSDLSEIKNKLLRVEEIMHKIAIENRWVKQNRILL